MHPVHQSQSPTSRESIAIKSWGYTEEKPPARPESTSKLAAAAFCDQDLWNKIHYLILIMADIRLLLPPGVEFSLEGFKKPKAGGDPLPPATAVSGAPHPQYVHVLVCDWGRWAAASQIGAWDRLSLHEEEDSSRWVFHDAMMCRCLHSRV